MWKIAPGTVRSLYVTYTPLSLPLFSWIYDDLGTHFSNMAPYFTISESCFILSINMFSSGPVPYPGDNTAKTEMDG